MKRSSLIAGVSYGALLAGLAQSAIADDLTVANGTVLTTPLETAKASNSTPGNITIDLGATVRVTEPGSAVTLNSNNSITHSGLIEALAPSGGIGVHVVGGFAGNFTAQGSAGAIINVTGPGTGNYGLLLDDPNGAGATFTGNISLTPGSTLLFYGENSTGVAINTRLDGSLVTGTLSGTGEGATGVKTIAEITGSFTHAGARSSVRGTATFTIENVDPLSGAGIAIGANIGGGFLISGPVSPGDGSTAIGAITNSSDAPTVIIAPSVAGTNAADITLGRFSTDTAGLDFSFLNRGNITATQNDVGIHTTAVRLGETSVTSLATRLENGFFNRGGIFSSSQSDNFFSTNATAVPTNATALEIGYGTTIEAFKAPDQTIASLGWDTKAASGSTTTTILLGADASDVDGIYEGFTVQVGAETRVVTDYVVVREETLGVVLSKTITLSAPLTSAPGTDAPLTILAPDGTSVVLGSAASGVSTAYNGFTILAGGDQRIITDYVVIYDPSTGTPTMRVAKVDQAWTGNTNPTSGTANISTSNLFNSGAIGANMGGSKGGVVTAILIQSGAALRGPAGELTGGSLTNYGAIDATARTSDTSIAELTAVAIDDRSGSLNTIVNHGRISATVTPLDNGKERAIAANLSRSSTPQMVSVFSAGDVTGDILFGSGVGNKLIIEGSILRTLSDGSQVADHSSVIGSVSSEPGSTLDVEVSRLGTGGALRTANVRATTMLVGAQGNVEFALGKDTGTAPIIATTGGVSFEGETQIALSPTSFLPANGTYTLIQAGVGNQVQFANFGATAKLNGNGSPVPFLFEGTFTADGQPLSGATGQVNANALNVTLRRKTATELGLQGNTAAIYEPLAAAALQDDVFGAALLTLTSADQVEAAVATTVPDIAGGMRALTVAMTDQATGVIGARQRSLLTAPEGSRTELRFWGQEFYNIVSLNSSDTHPGYGGAGLGVALGMEWGAIESGRFGVGYTFFSSQEVERHPRDTKTNGDWNMLSAYAAWRLNDFFFAPQLNVGAGNFKSRRTIAVGDVVGRSATANWTSYLAAGGATAGYIIELGNIDIIPTIAFDVMYFNQGAYEEVGGGGMGLSLRPQRQTSVRSFAGIIGQGTYSYNEGVFMPQLLAGWSHEFADDPATIDGFFESSPGSPFHLVGPTLDQNKIVGGMSFGYVMRNWSVGLNYDASANAGNLQQSATFGITTRF